MQRQTAPWDLWVVVDSGEQEVALGQHVMRARWPDAEVWSHPHRKYAMWQKLGLGVDYALSQGADQVLVIEDDDWYAPDHVETMVASLQERPLAAHSGFRMYHLGLRAWREAAAPTRKQKPKNLLNYQLGMSRRGAQALVAGVHAAKQFPRFWPDGWNPNVHMLESLNLQRDDIDAPCTAVGIKGAPGIGNFTAKVKDPERWTLSATKLAQWIGPEDALAYTELM